LISKYKLLALILVPAVVVLTVGLAFIQQKNQEMSRDQFEKLLYTSWHLARLYYERGPFEPEPVRKMTGEIGFRLTLINGQGQVTFDSEVPGELESHRDRPEIKAATVDKPIFATRISETTGIKTMYYAQKADSNTVLRVSSPMEYYENQRELFFRETILAVAFLTLAVLVFGLIVFRQFGRIYFQLSRAVERAKNGDEALPTFKSLDLDEALFSLSHVTRVLRDKNQEISFLNQRLEYILKNINEGVIFLDGSQILYHNERAEEILNCRIPDNITKITKKEVLNIFASVKKPQANQLRLGEKFILFDQTWEDNQLLVIFHDQTEKEKYTSYKSDLIGNISHELKTPLALILGASEVILKDKDMARPFLEKFLSALYKNAQRLNGLLDDLIVLHQLEARPEAFDESCDLGEIMGEIEEMIEPGDKKVNFSFDTGLIKCHSTHIISILTNLINNALKYSQGPEIEVSVRQKDLFLEISVSDLGPPIPESEYERIFERFYSISRSRNRSVSGSGLGLAIVKHIARLYQGQVQVTGNERGGNTFWVRLTAPKTVN
jgi:two-component system phosphate regulon sensor histidine kinase PhoR